PGNVRELRNVIERAVMVEADDEILHEHLPPAIRGQGARAASASLGGNPFPAGEVMKLDEVEKLAIRHALRVCTGNKTRAAAKLGISRQTLRTKLKEYEIEDDASEDDSET